MRVYSKFLMAAFFTSLCISGVWAATGTPKKSTTAKNPVAAFTGSGDIDQRIAAAEAEVSQLTATLEQLKQDSAKAAADASVSKSTTQAKVAPLESLLAQKTQELAGLRSQRDKARQDSMTLAIKKNGRSAVNKQEASHMDAAIMSASNQLNSYSTRKQQLPADEAGTEIKAVTAIQRDIARADSVIRLKQSDIAAWTKKRDQFRQDSLSEDSKASDARVHIQGDGKRLDSLLQLISIQNDAAGKQAKSKDISGNQAQEQAKLTDLMRQKTVVDAQIARLKGEISAVNAERERLRASTGATQKKLELDRSPLTEALAAAEAKLQDKLYSKEVITSLSEKIRLDSAIQKAKDALNTAIEQQALGKKGAEKLVNQRENEVTTLMGKLDDVVRKNPKVAQGEAQLSGLSSTSEKRKRIDSLLAGAAADIAAQSMARDQAKRALDEFDRTHPAAAATSTPKLTLFDSLSIAKEKSVTALAARRDSMENQIAVSQRSIETVGAASRLESAKADSAAGVTRKQRSDLMIQRAQVRTDSIKNESGLMVAMIRLRTEQTKIAVQTAALDREIAGLTVTKERFKQSITDAQNRDKAAKAANQLERKRLDSLIGAKEQEVTQLSMQNEKLTQDQQAAGKELDLLLQKQSLLMQSISAQIASAEQDAVSVSQQVESARKERAAAEKTGSEKIRAIERDKTATAASLAAKKTEIAGLKSQREGLQRGLKRELAHIDSMISAAGKFIAGYEAAREKARQDSLAAEAAKSDAQLKSVAALHSNDSVAALRQQQTVEASANLEKARQDSAAKSAAISGGAAQNVKTFDSLVAMKERELADLRQQREKARQDLVAEQRRQFTALVAAHQEIVGRRTLVEQKRAESAMAQTQRRKLQQDSAAAVARHLQAARTAGGEIFRNAGLSAKRNDEMAALQAQRADVAAKLSAMGADAPPPAAMAISATPATAAPAPSSAAASTDVGQKQLEEIYLLIGANKTDDAVARFNALRGLLAKTVNAEAFAVLKYTIEQIEEQKKNKGKKK